MEQKTVNITNVEQRTGGGVFNTINLLEGEVGAEKIAEWKLKYPEGIYAAVSADKHITYFKKPSMLDIRASMPCQTSDNMLGHIEALADLTHIGGSELYRDEHHTQLRLGVYNVVKEMLLGTETRLVNL